MSGLPARAMALLNCIFWRSLKKFLIDEMTYLGLRRSVDMNCLFDMMQKTAPCLLRYTCNLFFTADLVESSFPSSLVWQRLNWVSGFGWILLHIGMERWGMIFRGRELRFSCCTAVPYFGGVKLMIPTYLHWVKVAWDLAPISGRCLAR